MTLFCSTPEEIDDFVRRGVVVGQIVQGDAANDVPPLMGDWSLRLAAGTGGVKSIVVAIPTNSRTRNIYNTGRKVWLKKLGFTEELIEDYIEGSAGAMYRWEEEVAKFVLANKDMTNDTWYDIARSRNPMQAAQNAGIGVGLPRTRLMAGLNILMNIWELAD